MRLFFPNGADEDGDDFEPPSQMGEEVNYPERFVNKPRVKGDRTTNNRKRLMSISEMSQSLTSQKDEHEIPESSPVVYKEEELSAYLKNIILARQEIQQSRIRHTIEIEKIDVLTNYYNDKIKEEIAKIKK